MNPDTFPSTAMQQTGHRPWPLPDQPWVMKQQWRDLLFLHWPVEPAVLRQRIPAELELDRYDGKAWLGVVPFDMKGVTRRGYPAPSFLCDFPEINLRTYVTHRGKPGVWFLSLDVPGRLAVWAARKYFHLPYFRADISCEVDHDRVQYRHRREDLRFQAEYVPVSDSLRAPGEFAQWATARYALYCQSPQGQLFRGDIHHAPWPLKLAEVKIKENTFLDRFPVGPQHPQVLYSKAIDVVVYPLQRL